MRMPKIRKTSVKKERPTLNEPAIASNYALTQSRMRKMLEDAFVAGYESPIELMKQEIDRIFLEEAQERQENNSPARVKSKKQNVDSSLLSPAFFSAEGAWKQYTNKVSASEQYTNSLSASSYNTISSGA